MASWDSTPSWMTVGPLKIIEFTTVGPELFHKCNKQNKKNLKLYTCDFGRLIYYLKSDIFSFLS